MKKIFLPGLLALLLICQGCASLRNSLTKTGTQWNGGDFRITLYSGGKAVRGWDVKNAIVDEEEGSDGWLFSCRGNLVRLSGDVVVEPLSEAKTPDVEPYVCN